ncbi:probable LRR receptor-like serine/threonine-protein kinase At5g45780 [Arachis stenosperma]|uniref:probable LRR receptor-like serine/threonine-protein kinase At5g45780 n=1 Tax=Arachis stenosperma TaxID=217475 RepID=UPI0025AD3618|nr:probable LRR receptor-like serine/threonine-protein kinase At5g45780 [Arachis stenosperma]XP_057743176.1 probable LRR receptor-like serine/threonine-protein kinase At5g45780 [Arachis stenosperma]XP_057743177.1 probable LRR receptor-like serine/threonine-protein kinase At5g45780 [Arachis stenosperma]XP_057743178.1 probable LRR receptor-like serine/threonine-protein kinase At5g45780 [Arachis stenosperma]XP_057743179.1 probable LRR receptor-like serine/threonine-protein kinase At5g45780 [Arachi
MSSQPLSPISLPPTLTTSSFPSFPFEGNGQCWFIWSSFVRNWKFEPSLNINNQLFGPIPAEIGKLSELQTLDLSSNQFVREIPSSLGLLSQLSYLRLNKNNLSEQIPPLVANLTGLSFLDLSFNNLSGPTPKILTKDYRNLIRVSTNGTISGRV